MWLATLDSTHYLNSSTNKLLATPSLFREIQEYTTHQFTSSLAFHSSATFVGLDLRVPCIVDGLFSSSTPTTAFSPIRSASLQLLIFAWCRLYGPYVGTRTWQHHLHCSALYVSHAADHVMKFPRPSSVFAYYRWSKTGGIEGLGMWNSNYTFQPVQRFSYGLIPRIRIPDPIPTWSRCPPGGMLAKVVRVFWWLLSRSTIGQELQVV